MKDTMVAETVIKTLTTKKLGKTALALREFDQIFDPIERREGALPEGAIDWLINKIKPQPEIQRLIERLINHTVSPPISRRRCACLRSTARRLSPSRAKC